MRMAICVGIICVLGASAHAAVIGKATVTADQAPVMSGKQVVATAKKGDTFDVTEVKGDWFGVAPSQGWIHKANVRFDPKSEPAPNKLTFAPAQQTIAAGDQWVYAVRSANAALDGRTITFSCIAADTKTIRFKCKFGDSAEREFVLGKNAATFIVPAETAPTVFEAIGLISMDEAVTIEKDYRWRQQSLVYTRPGDPSSTEGHLVVGLGPVTCAVPAGTFHCAKIQKHSIKGGQVQSLVGESWNTPRTPFAVRARVPRSKGTALLYVELLSCPKSAVAGKTGSPEIPKEERDKLLQWIKTNCVDESLQDHLVSLFHIALADHPNETVEWTLGSALTKTGKGVFLTVSKGKFSVVREVAASDESSDAKNSLTERVRNLQ